MNCNICVNKFNNSIRKPISCECNYSVCKSCVKQWIISSGRTTCMSCGVTWSNKFINNNLPMSFIQKELKKIRLYILMNQQRNLLANCMEDCKRYKLFKELQNKQHYINIDIMKLYLSKRNIKINKHKLSDDNYNNFMKQFYKDLSVLRTQKDSNSVSIREIDIYQQLNNDAKQILVISCPTGSCKGTIQNYECSLCQVEVCNKCYSVNDSEHVCSEEDIKTYEDIVNSVKSCPSCREAIFKTEGCDTMFCTLCKTGFDWLTLEIIRDRNQIHNPHFFEQPDVQLLVHQNDMRYYTFVNGLDFKSINLPTSLQHIRDQLISSLITYDRGLHVLRLKYLSGEITDSRWSYLSYKIDRDIIISNSILAIINSQLDNEVVNLTCRVIVSKSQDEIDIIDSEFNDLFTKMNNQILEVYSDNNCKSVNIIKPYHDTNINFIFGRP